MKRIWSVLLSLMLLAVLAVSAQADLLWSPVGNAFYDRHWEELETVMRDFAANGEKGFVTLWDAPGGSGVTAQYENGEKLEVYYVYRDWGLIRAVEETTGRKELYGWTPLADLSLLYDHISFAEDYQDQLRDYQGEFADYSGSLDRICLYEYPGASEVKLEIGPQTVQAEKWRERLTGTEKGPISRIFVDEEGLTWGYIEYLYGPVEGWFCLDEPGGADFPIRQVPEVEFTPPRTPVTPAAAYVPYVLVGGAAVVTAGLLYWFYARKRGAKAR